MNLVMKTFKPRRFWMLKRVRNNDTIKYLLTGLLLTASLNAKCDRLKDEAELVSVKWMKAQQLLKGLKEEAEINSAELMRAQEQMEVSQKEAKIRSVELTKAKEQIKMLQESKIHSVESMKAQDHKIEELKKELKATAAVSLIM